MDKRPIGIFDSGIGGLTVFSEAKKRFVNEDLIYLGDTAHFPYGPKSKEEIINFTKKNIAFLINQKCKLIIIACGTATSQALEIVKNNYEEPIIGIIEPTVEAILQEDIDTIGIIATEGTIRANSWENAIKNRNSDIHVINKACPLLAKMAEEDFKKEEVKKVLKEYLEPFKNRKIDKLILGCTHYPIFKELIEKELENQTKVISTSEIVCKYVEQILKEQNKQNEETNKGDYKIFLTDKKNKFIEISNRLFQTEEDKIYIATFPE